MFQVLLLSEILPTIEFYFSSSLRNFRVNSYTAVGLSQTSQARFRPGSHPVIPTTVTIWQHLML